MTSFCVVKKYLNNKIIQSEHGISVDQTDFINDILLEFIPRNMKIPRTDTPLWTDKQFSIDILDAIPADEAEWQRLWVEYKADFRSIFGK